MTTDKRSGLRSGATVLEQFALTARNAIDLVLESEVIMDELFSSNEQLRLENANLQKEIANAKLEGMKEAIEIVEGRTWTAIQNKDGTLEFATMHWVDGHIQGLKDARDTLKETLEEMGK